MKFRIYASTRPEVGQGRAAASPADGREPRAPALAGRQPCTMAARSTSSPVAAGPAARGGAP